MGRQRTPSRRMPAVALVGALLAGLVGTAAATVEGEPAPVEEPTTTTTSTAAPATTVPVIESSPTAAPPSAPPSAAEPFVTVAAAAAETSGTAVADPAAGALDEAAPAEGPDITITKEAAVDEVLRNKVVEFTITVENTGDVDLVDVEVVDVATPDCEDDTGALPVGGDPWSYDCYAYNVQGDEDEDEDDDVFTNVAVVRAEVPVICVELTEDAAGAAACEGEEVKDQASAAVAVIDPDPAIAITKTALDPVVFAGEDADFEITVTNTGNVELSDIEVADDLVEDCEDAFDDADFDSLDPGESVMFTCTASSVSGGGDGDGDGDVFTNVAGVVGVDFSDCYEDLAVPSEYGCCGEIALPSEYECEGEEVFDEDDAEVMIARPGMSITKSALASPVTTGGNAGFAITVTNTGNVRLTGITVADPLAPNCRRTSVALNAGQTAAYTCTATGVTDAADGVIDGRFTNGASATATFRGRSFTDDAAAAVALTDPVPEPPPPPISIEPIVITDPLPGDPDPDPDPPEPDDPAGTSPAGVFATGDDSVHVSGSTVLLTGATPGCALTVFVDGVAVAATDESADPGAFEFEVATGELAFGRHDAEVRCDDGSTVFEQPFTLIQPINNSSGLTAILAFVVLLLLLVGWRFVVSGRDAPGPT